MYSDSLNFNLNCKEDVYASCNVERLECYTASGKVLRLKIIENIQDIKEIAASSFGGILYFKNNDLVYQLKKDKGVMMLEYLRDHGMGKGELVIAGLHVIASWEFDILKEMDWGYIYLPLKAHLEGDFVPLNELVSRSVRVGLGSGDIDADLGICDFRCIVWTAYLNQFNILRDKDAILGVYVAAHGAPIVYRDQSFETVKISPQEALADIVNYARSR